MRIDGETLRDLEIFRTRDGKPGVFGTLDRTRTSGGRQALRFRFENPMSDSGLIRQVQEGIEFLRLHDFQFEPDPGLVEEVRGYLESSWDVASRAGGLRFLLESVVVSVSYKDLFQHARSGVAATGRLISQLRSWLERIAEEDPPSEIRRPVENLLALIRRMKLDAVRSTRRPWALARTDRYLRVERKADFQRFFELLSDLDALCSMAEAVEADSLVLPEVVDGEAFVLEGGGIFHPFVEEPVGNPVELSEGRTVLFLTGPNMAGKTTYLKAVGIAAYLAHLGMGVPARRFRFSPLDGMFSNIRPEDNLRSGLSSFLAEVRRVKTIAEAVANSRRTLAVMDEVFRGTNVKDAYEASRLVIEGLAGSRASGLLVATHLVELADALGENPAIHFACFDGQIEGGRARYGFRMREGVSRARFGLQLLEEEGVPALLSAISA